MVIRPEVRFSSGFPNDYVMGDGEDPDVQAGANVAEALKMALEQLNYRVAGPINAGDNGWELDIWRGRKRLWLQISVLDADECYLAAENMTSWLWPDVTLFRSFLSDLHSILKADSRFSRVGWLPKGGIHRGAAPRDRPFDP
ncbi:MAG: hypothetical protein ABW360_16975 [Phenylobacterium sp.]